MEKEFVSYELALKLKELGFKERCLTYYGEDKPMIYDGVTIHGWDHNTSFLNWTSRPTFSQAFRWFRDEHGVSVYVSPLEEGSAFYHMIYTNINVPYSNRICSLPSKWNTYEEAELACLDKLIEIVETKKEK
jgi:hypothetical protein